MGVAALSIRMKEDLKRVIVARARGQHRKPSEQARRYIEIALIAEENPDLPFGFIQGILEARAEKDAGLVEELDWSAG